jgi:hypothetical protein
VRKDRVAARLLSTFAVNVSESLHRVGCRPVIDYWFGVFVSSVDGVQQNSRIGIAKAINNIPMTTRNSILYLKVAQEGKYISISIITMGNSTKK